MLIDALGILAVVVGLQVLLVRRKLPDHSKSFSRALLRMVLFASEISGAALAVAWGLRHFNLLPH